jgi:hypothetical protein
MLIFVLLPHQPNNVDIHGITLNVIRKTNYFITHVFVFIISLIDMSLI